MIYLVRAIDVNIHNQIPILVRHIFKADIPQDAGIVDKYVYPPKALYCGLDDALAIFNRVVVRYSLTASCFYFFNDFVGGL